MKINKETPVIIRYVFRQEASDGCLGECLWAIFDMDPSRGILNICSDCGNYSYRWPERDDKFLKLLAGMGNEKSYLLRKLCGPPKYFSLEKTMALVEEILNDADDIDPAKKESALSLLHGRLLDYLGEGKDVPSYIIEEWNREEELELDNAWEMVCTEYSYSDEKVVNIFCAYIVPEIRKLIEQKGE